MGLPKHSWLDRMALGIFTTPVMWGFFAFINIFTIAYILTQEYLPQPFDPYPYTFLNLILAVFVAEMDVIIVIAGIVAGYKADWQMERIGELVEKGDRRDELAFNMMENHLAMMRSLQDMAAREVERDQILSDTLNDVREILKGGSKRGDILDTLILDTKSSETDSTTAES